MNALNTITFTSRATYINWVAEWKIQHAQLIVDIRKSKIAIKEADRKNVSSGPARHQLWNLRRDIFASELIRADGKVEAQKQYLAEHTPVTTA